MHSQKKANGGQPTTGDQILRELTLQKSGTVYQKAWWDFSEFWASRMTSARNMKMRQVLEVTGTVQKPHDIKVCDIGEAIEDD